ncbi:uncharacterized protein [Euphorbia lathyris]|uniref:uncharacterized protein n=1 Tax=Euphorbia lathyris TaxID=212925 RepID=UPI0033134806
MQRWNQHSRVNLAELKTHIVEKVGVERSKLYFYYLNKFLNLKLSKVEFNKLCFRVLGRENIPLHNQLICSILKNACNAKATPPSSHRKEVSATISDGSHTFSNGKVDFASHHSTITGDNIASEDDGLQKLLQHHQVIFERAERDGEVFFHHPLKTLQSKQSIDGSISVQDKEQSELSVVQGRKETSALSALVAPLGIPFCNASVGGARKPLPLPSIHRCASSYDTGAILESHSLRERMQKIAAAHGLDGVSMDSANLLKHSLDVFLKSLIKSCVQLVGTSCGSDVMEKDSRKHNSQGKLVNGLLPGHRMPVQSSSRLLDGMQGQRSQFSISLLDFKVAMELTPQQLGEDWPLLLEKIMYSFEE